LRGRVNAGRRDTDIRKGNLKNPMWTTDVTQVPSLVLRSLLDLVKSVSQWSPGRATAGGRCSHVVALQPCTIKPLPTSGPGTEGMR
jgi:hypothetical protein